MKPTVCTIYCLINPFNNEAFYIGRTFNTLRHRLKAHISEAKIKKSEKNDIINCIISEGGHPVCKELELMEDEIRLEADVYSKRERHWIRLFCKGNKNLTNIIGNPKKWAKKHRKIQCDGWKNKRILKK